MVRLARQERIEVGARRQLRRGREGRGGIVYVRRRPRRARRSRGVRLGALPRGGVLHCRGGRVLAGGQCGGCRRRSRTLRGRRYFEAHAPGASTGDSGEGGTQNALEEILLRRALIDAGSSPRLSHSHVNRYSDDNRTDSLRSHGDLRRPSVLDVGRLLASSRIGDSCRCSDVAAEGGLNVLQMLLQVLL